MIRPDGDLRVYLCREPVDMRKQIDGPALLVQEAMELNPFEETLFVFGNRQRDKVKLWTCLGLTEGTSNRSRGVRHRDDGVICNPQEMSHWNVPKK